MALPISPKELRSFYNSNTSSSSLNVDVGVVEKSNKDLKKVRQLKNLSNDGLTYYTYGLIYQTLFRKECSGEKDIIFFCYRLK